MAFLLAVFLTLMPDPTPTTMVAGTYVEGDLTMAETRLLRALDDRLIPLPDTVRVRPVQGTGVWQGGTIVMDPHRHQAPWDTNRKMPYLYGGTQTTVVGAPRPSHVYTLAHELAHWLQWRLWNGHPRLPGVLWWTTDAAARGPFAIRRETEADLIAAALLHIVFDLRLGALGFPDETWAGRTDSLVQGYAGRVGDAYRFPVDQLPPTDE